MTEDPSGMNYTTTYAWDVLDDLTTVTQGSQMRTFVYDAQGRMVSATNPESGTLCYGTVSGSTCTEQYDGNGNLQYRTDPRGVVTTYYYDALNRPTGIAYSDGTPAVTYAWDSGASYSKARLVSVTTTAGTVDKITGYDASGNIITRMDATNDQDHRGGCLSRLVIFRRLWDVFGRGDGGETLSRRSAYRHVVCEKLWCHN